MVQHVTRQLDSVIHTLETDYCIPVELKPVRLNSSNGCTAMVAQHFIPNADEAVVIMNMIL